jgi:hypothetical protein
MSIIACQDSGVGGGGEFASLPVIEPQFSRRVSHSLVTMLTVSHGFDLNYEYLIKEKLSP